MIATEQDVAKNATKKFVSKIQDINYTEVIPEAVGNWLEFTKSLNEDLDNSPIYKEKTALNKSRFSIILIIQLFL